MGEEGAAFIKTRFGSTLSAEEVQAFCKMRLASDKMPKYVFLSMPFLAVTPARYGEILISNPGAATQRAFERFSFRVRQSPAVGPVRYDCARSQEM